MSKIRSAGAATVVVVLALVAVVVIGVVAWQLGWFIREKNTDRGAQVNQRTFQRQNALVEQVVDDITEIEDLDVQIASGVGPVPQLQAQREAITDQVCDSAALLTGSIELPLNAEGFVAANC